MKTSSSCNLNCLCMKFYYNITNVAINEFSNMIIMIFLSKIKILLTKVKGKNYCSLFFNAEILG